MVWYSHLFKNFPHFVIHTLKGFHTVNKAEVDVVLELSCFFNDPLDVGNLISGSSAFSKSSLNIWKFMVHVLLKLGLENFEHYFASMWDECNCAVVWAFFSIAFLIDLLTLLIRLLITSWEPKPHDLIWTEHHETDSESSSSEFWENTIQSIAITIFFLVSSNLVTVNSLWRKIRFIQSFSGFMQAA